MATGRAEKARARARMMRTDERYADALRHVREDEGKLVAPCSGSVEAGAKPTTGKNRRTGPMVSGHCRLCLQHRSLCRSHIIPRWVFLRALRKDAVHTYPSLIQVKDGIAEYSNDQMVERLLCKACEDRIEVWEKYVSENSRQRDGDFPALRGLAPVRGIPSSSGELRGYDAPGLRTNDLAAFGASVLWRASVSTTFGKVDLDPYEEQFRQYLLGETSFIQNAAIVVQMIESPIVPIDETILGPQELERPDPYHRVYRFVVAGMMYLVAVGELLPDCYLDLCVAYTGRVLVGPGTPLAHATAASFATALAVGRLGREAAGG